MFFKAATAGEIVQFDMEVGGGERRILQRKAEVAGGSAGVGTIAVELAVAVAVVFDVRAATVAVAVAVAVVFEVAVAVQIPVERAVAAVPGADKVRRLFEHSEAERV